MNIIDYVKIYGKKTFEQLPFGPVDAAVLCQLCYLKLEKALPKGKASLLQTMKSPNRDGLFEDARFGENLRSLYFEAAFSRRYQNMIIRSPMSVKGESVFAAFVFAPEGSAEVVCFRGTDESMSGWKENFRLAYKYPVESQRLAAHYVEKTMKRSGEFYIIGHSKGGNLAQYSAMHIPPSLRSKIKLIYNLDGPGFMKDLSAEENYGEIKSRISKLVPEKSFVGQLLQDGALYKRVKSEGVGILQHDLFKWHTDGFGQFIFLEDDMNAYKPIARRLNSKIAQLTPQQLDSFTEAFFGIFENAGIDSLLDFSKDWLKSGKDVLAAISDMDDETKKLLIDTVRSLVF